MRRRISVQYLPPTNSKLVEKLVLQVKAELDAKKIKEEAKKRLLLDPEELDKIMVHNLLHARPKKMKNVTPLFHKDR